MAKKYYEAFISSLETQYAAGIAPVMGMAALNDRIKLIPIENKGSHNSGTQVNVQRQKRYKAKTSVYDNSKGAGDNLMARYNSAQEADWETIEITAANKMDLFVITPLNTEYEMDNISADHQKAIDAITKNRLVALEENAEAALAAAGTLAGKIDLTKGEEALQLTLDTIRNIELLVDDYKAMSSTVVCLIHPLIADLFSKVHGIMWRGAPDTFPGAPKEFTYSGIRFIVAPLLNTIQGTTAKDVIGIVAFDVESFISGGLDFNLVEVQDRLIDVVIQGHTYSSLNKVIDPARVAKLEFELPTSVKKSKKVND